MGKFSYSHVIQIGTFSLTELLTKLVEPGSGKKYPCNCLPECDQVSFHLDKENKGEHNM